MSSSPSFEDRGYWPMNNQRGRLGTLRAMAALCCARVLVAFVRFERWSGTLGGRNARGQEDAPLRLSEARQLARQVVWAAERLPFESKCLPRAVALSWILRRKLIDHAIIFAVRPAKSRNSAYALHACVEINGTKIIGDLPGPWLETLRFGES